MTLTDPDALNVELGSPHWNDTEAESKTKTASGVSGTPILSYHSPFAPPLPPSIQVQLTSMGVYQHLVKDKGTQP